MFTPLSIRNLVASILAISTISPLISIASDLDNSNEPVTKNAAQDANPGIQNNSYILGPGDVLNLNLIDVPELSGDLKVLSDGSISLPYIGALNVDGLTIDQASKFVQDQLGSQLLRPELQLKVVQPRPIRVSLIGEIERPGLYSLSPQSNSSSVSGSEGTLQGLPTVFNAIQNAGGITQQANLRKVELQRLLPGNKRKYKRTYLDLLSVILEGNQTENPFLFDGDIIKLVKAEELSKQDISVSSVNLSPQTITVNIIGEVVRPGSVTVKTNTPLSQGLLAAGGPLNWRSNKGKVDLVRINKNGSATLNQYRVNISKPLSKQNPALKNGDTIRVRRNAFAKANDALGAVSQPLSGVVTIYSLFRIIN